MDIENEINNDINLEKRQKNFLNTMLGKTINTAIDIGLKAILPDLIEDQVIQIKDALLNNGLKEGIHSAIDSALDFGKSAIGIFTGNFENTNQIKLAIGNGGLIDTSSKLLDKVTDRIYQLGYINETINNVIKKGKNVLLDNVEKNIEKELNKQNSSIEKIATYVDNWERCYNNKDFNGMEKEYKKIENIIDKIVPIENVIKRTREVENIHNLISNNGHNFDISELEIELNKKL